MGRCDTVDVDLLVNWRKVVTADLAEIVADLGFVCVCVCVWALF